MSITDTAAAATAIGSKGVMRDLSAARPPVAHLALFLFSLG